MRRWVLIVACAGLFLVQLDVTIVNVALARIGRGLGASTSGLQWVVDGYALVLATLMLTAGEVADRSGRRRVFVAGLAIFAAGSAVCALAPSIAVLVAGRVVQGLGAAAMLPTSLAIVQHAFPEPGERARAIGAWAAVSALALVTGPVIGGALAGGPGWRAVFWLTVPLALTAATLALRTVPESRGVAGRRIDVAGQALGSLTLAAIVFACIEGGRLGWGSPVVAAALVAAPVALLAFVAVERRAADPMLDVSNFRRPAFSAPNAAAGLMNFGILGVPFSLSLFFQDVEGKSPAATGVRLLPVLAPLALLATLGGRATGRIGPRLPAGAGLAVTGAALAALAGLGPGSSYAAVACLLAIAGTGLAFATPALVTAATGALPAHRAGVASAVNNTARQAGGAIGVALIGGLGSIHAALLASGTALLTGGALAGTWALPPRPPDDRRS